MDTLTNQFENLDIIEKFLLGKNLSAERGFVDKVEEKIKELNLEKINLLHYIGKAVMCITFEGESLRSYGDTFKIIKLTEETFALKRKLRKIDWLQIMCRKKDTTKQLPEFVLVLFMLITSPTIEHKEIILLNLSLANVFFVNSLMHFTLNYLVTSNGRKKRSKN